MTILAALRMSWLIPGGVHCHAERPESNQGSMTEGVAMVGASARVAGGATAGLANDAQAASSLLLDLPVPFRRIEGVLHVEAQAHNGIHRWLDNFRQVTICAPCVPEHLVDPSMSWLPADDLLAREGLQLRELPWGYHPLDHLRHRARVGALYSDLIANHQCLCFSNLGWAGAWGNIAAQEAWRQGRSYAVWLDWVLHDMHPAQGAGAARGFVGALRGGFEKRRSLAAIGRAELGLFHGRTVYEAYAPIARNPHVVHNIHLKRDDVIPRPELAARLDRDTAVALIGYVGRVHDMKGPLQWIDALALLASRGCRFMATWLGEGPLLEECRRQVAQRGLADFIAFPGAQRDRAKVLDFLRSLDLFAFCHLTQESPRCLIEALMSGVPIVGYDSAYARDLVASTDGGHFVAIGDVAGLADRLQGLLASPQARRAASLAALEAGEHFSDDAVFAHRSDLIKRHLVKGGSALPAGRSDTSLGRSAA
jgi:glycosyltransferase involved in cell wall biosynthesis